MNAAPRLRARAIAKAFGATRALDGVDLELAPGTVHALIGENGAGKSTLVRILCGDERPDHGTLELDGRDFAPRSPREARNAGVVILHQELSIAPDLSVAENLLLGRERARFGLLARAGGRALARAALARLGRGDIDLDQRAGDLPLAHQQIVEIARALLLEARVVAFDEPTSSLSEADVPRLHALVRDLARQGIAVVYVSHFLEEIARVCDRYTVLRDGRAVGSGPVAGTATEQLVALMAGSSRAADAARPACAPGEVLLAVRGLSGERAPREIDLDVRRGQILGLFGLVGAGRSELLRVLFGLERRVAGHAALAGGTPIARSPRESLAAGVAFLSEDRKGEGLALGLSIEDNLTLARLAPYARAGVIASARRRAAAVAWIQRVRCKARGPTQSAAELSGGNQQKIALARILHQDARLVLLDEPTRGIDVATKAEIYRWIGALAAEGRAVVLTSSYLPELLQVCDRIGVLCRGRLVDVKPAAEWTPEAMLHAATGAAESARP